MVMFRMIQDITIRMRGPGIGQYFIPPSSLEMPLINLSMKNLR